MTIEENQSLGAVVIEFPGGGGRHACSNHVEERAPEADPKSPGPGSRGVETLFRSLYNTHLTLDSMADNKSRMMIQVNGLMLSVLIAEGTRMAGSLGPLDLGAAAFALLGAAAASMLFAVLAARPRSQRRSMFAGRQRPTRGGLLFFSEFADMDCEEYVESMNDLMEEPAALYENMSRNLHALGRLLQRKYTLLRLSYGALAIGVMAAAVSQLCVQMPFS